MISCGTTISASDNGSLEQFSISLRPPFPFRLAGNRSNIDGTKEAGGSPGEPPASLCHALYLNSKPNDAPIVRGGA